MHIQSNRETAIPEIFKKERMRKFVFACWILKVDAKVKTKAMLSILVRCERSFLRCSFVDCDLDSKFRGTISVFEILS